MDKSLGQFAYEEWWGTDEPWQQLDESTRERWERAANAVVNEAVRLLQAGEWHRLPFEARHCCMDMAQEEWIRKRLSDPKTQEQISQMTISNNPDHPKNLILPRRGESAVEWDNDPD